MRNIVNQTNVHKGNTRRRGEKEGEKTIVKEIMTENLANIKNIHLHSSSSSIPEETKIFAHRQIMVRLLKVKHQGKFLKTVRKIGHMQGTLIRFTFDLS